MTTSDDRTPYTPGPYATGGFIPAPSSQRPPSEHLLLGPAPAPKKRRRLWLILAVVVGLVVVLAVVVGITLAGMRGGTSTASKPAGQSAWAEEQQRRIDATPAVEPTQAAATPTATDVKLTPKITSKECFGSAGCLVTLKVNAQYNGPVLSPDDTWLVTYEVNGVEDGPLIGSFEMTGDQYTVNEESVSTKSSRSKVTVKVTDVEKVGL